MRQFRTFERTNSIFMGTEAFSGGATAPGTLTRIGLLQLSRTTLNRWSEIETAPGVYDWSKTSLSQVIAAHRVGSEAVVPVSMAGAVPAFYPSSLANPTTRSAAVAFITAFVGQLHSSAGDFLITFDPRVQETVFAATGALPADWASFYVALAAAVHGTYLSIDVLTDVVGDNHNLNLPGTWFTTVAAVSDGIGIQETAQLVSTVLSDIDWFYEETGGRKVWLLGSSFSTSSAVDTRAHGTEAEQANYFNTLLANLAVPYAGKAQAWIQLSAADRSTGTTWADRLGLMTNGMVSDKPAVAPVSLQARQSPPYHTVYIQHRTIDLALGYAFELGYHSLTDFDYLEWRGLVDLSQATAVRLRYDVVAGDGYPGYLLRVGSTWRQLTTAEVDVKPWITHGNVTLELSVPSARLTGIYQVTGLEVTVDRNAGLPDLFPPLVDGVEVGKRLKVEFTDTLDPLTASSPSNYEIRDPSGNALPVLGAALVGPTTVQVSTGLQKPLNYRLYVRNVKDEAGNAMTPDTLMFKGHPEAGQVPTPYRPYDLSAWSAPEGIQIILESRGEAGPLQLEIYDVSGRRIRATSFDASSDRSWSWLWSGRSDSGTQAARGIYFIRASGRRGSAVTRAVLSR